MRSGRVDAWGRACSRTSFVCGTLGVIALFAFVQPVLARQLSQTNSVHRAPLSRPGGRALSIGFYVNDDDNSFPDLKKVSPHLDWLIPSWLTLEGQNLTLGAHVDQTVLRYLDSAKPDMPILPMVQNYSGDKWDGDGLAKLLADARARSALIQDLKTFLDQNGFQGLTVDFEEVPPSAHPDLELFLRELRKAFADRSYAIILAVPIDDDGWPYETYANIVDYLLLMGYDEHWSTGSLGKHCRPRLVREGSQQAYARVGSRQDHRRVGSLWLRLGRGRTCGSSELPGGYAVGPKVESGYSVRSPNPESSLLVR